MSTILAELVVELDEVAPLLRYAAEQQDIPIAPGFMPGLRRIRDLADQAIKADDEAWADLLARVEDAS